jgi:hypothetical protein
MADTTRSGFSRLAVVITVVAAGLAVLHAAPPASAVVTSVKGSACGYISNVGLFGGPQHLQGCGTTADPGDLSYSPFVSLPPTGSAAPITETDPDGARAIEGPAVLYGGRAPCDPTNCPAGVPPSGPMTVSTVGTPAGGTVASSTDIVLFPPPQPPVRCDSDPLGTFNCYAPGGAGPWPAEADEVHVRCTASERRVVGTTTFVNAQFSRLTDGDTPLEIENIPANPPPNLTRHGVLTNIGDVYTVVFNEQISNPDGSLTVNGMHVYLFGPVAIGEVIKGQVTCGTTPGPPPVDNLPPTCGEPALIRPFPGAPPVEPQQVFLGMFDTAGIQSVQITQQNNVSVQVGRDPTSDQQYMRFTPGQTGPLILVATRQNPKLPTSWSFTATDTFGNATQGTVTATTGEAPVLTVSCQGASPPTTTSSTTTSTPTSSSTSTTSPPTTSSSTTTTSVPSGPDCAELAAQRARVNLQIDLAEQQVRDTMSGPAEEAAIAQWEAVRAKTNATISAAQASLGCPPTR